MTPRNEYGRRLQTMCAEHGWTVAGLSGSGHLRLTKPGHRPVFVPWSPGGPWRALKNLRAELRRIERGTAA